MYKIIYLLFVFIFNFSFSQKILNIKDFGAKGNGINDDYKAIQRTFNEALKYRSVTIYIPSGDYSLSQNLSLNFVDNDIKIIGQVANKKPLLFVKKYSNILMISGPLLKISAGSITIENIDFKGYNEPYSPNHPYAHQGKWFSGINISNKKKVLIDNVTVSDIYGEGIILAHTQRVDIPLSARFYDVTIKNSQIINVWGLNVDEYGDALYISNVSKALIQNNKITNNVKRTKQLGRCGIVIEYMAENVKLTNNVVVGGYDRLLHLEASYGGHIIEKNNFFGSDVGMVISESHKKNKKTIVRYNNFSNKYFIKNPKLNILFANNATNERAFIYINTQNLDNDIDISDNTFILNTDFTYYGVGFINSLSPVTNVFRNTMKKGNSKVKLLYNSQLKSLKENKIID